MKAFCTDVLAGKHPSLIGVPDDESGFILRAFLKMYREARFATTGEFTGERQQAMAGTTVEEAALLGKTMWDSYGFSAFHEKGD